MKSRKIHETSGYIYFSYPLQIFDKKKGGFIQLKLKLLEELKEMDVDSIYKNCKTIKDYQERSKQEE